ncbi:unnamed protein product, partial [Brassica rapa]
MLSCFPHYVFPPPCPEYKLALLNHLPYLIGAQPPYSSLSTAAALHLPIRCPIDIAGRIRVKIWES